MKRKTIDVKFLIEYGNTQLSRTDEWATKDFKSGICCMIEKTLHETNNYKGFFPNTSNTLVNVLDSILGIGNWQNNNSLSVYLSSTKIRDGFLSPGKLYDSLMQALAIAQLNCSYSGGKFQLWQVF